MDRSIKKQLLEQAEEEYKVFSTKLIPNTENILGVRLPALRKIAKQIAKDDWRTFLSNADNEYFEEIMLQGMVIGCSKADIDETLDHVKKFVPKIDNWSICDSFCAGLKITKQNKERVWEFLKPYFSSEREYDIRFGVVMLLNYYIVDEYIRKVLTTLDHIKHEGYYAKMAVAWAVSICYIRLPKQTLRYLKNNQLDDFTYNKALQKITESLTVDKDTKVIIRSMKRV
ncbi:3-methyladenine DNA glycosylase AlkD [Mobilisporobacter senegalensis]|uniref:3-methyladenine DNA glycosylase AlkD n=1 Tax=Mobilisporobacter senegalensis TaxID=1329262 RepID=A0A3N1XRL2_9FIRM|nr:DNA alkylation repair protein [Mobilisporobacter senegalensis]ROR27437.1 3-methyladenine DNA glycosylase AlkD [Mobilisporobacter senegalensis]